MTHFLVFIGAGWLLAAISAALWLRKYPARPIGRRHQDTRRGRPLDVLGCIGIVFEAYGGSRLQTRYHAGLWIIPAVFVPWLFLGIAAPILIRRWQLRHAAHPPADLDSSAGILPTA